MSGELSPALAEQLARVEASTDGICEYRPCRVTLRGGATHDRVYVVERESYLRAWGVLPESDCGKESVSPADVVAIDAPSIRGAIADAPVDRLVFKGGRLVASSSSQRRVHR